MTFFLNPKIGLTLILFFLLRIVDADPSFKGVIFIISSLILIYLNQKNYSKKLLVLIFSLFVISFFANEKKRIEELSFPLKMSENSDDIYLGIFKKEKFDWIKYHYIEFAPDCYTNIFNCFQESLIDDFYVSPDQLFFNLDNSISRKVNEVNFSSLANARLSFINPPSGKINRNINKLNTPYFIQYTELENILSICFKGLAFVEYKNNNSTAHDHVEEKCISANFDTFSGINLPEKNLEVKIISN